MGNFIRKPFINVSQDYCIGDWCNRCNCFGETTRILISNLPDIAVFKWHMLFLLSKRDTKEDLLLIFNVSLTYLTIESPLTSQCCLLQRRCHDGMKGIPGVILFVNCQQNYLKICWLRLTKTENRFGSPSSLFRTSDHTEKKIFQKILSRNWDHFLLTSSTWLIKFWWRWDANTDFLLN